MYFVANRYLLTYLLSSENAVREECAIPVCLGDNDNNLGESNKVIKSCLEAWVKMNKFNFLIHKCICSNLNTINLKLFGNHGGIYRFRRNFKKDWRKKPLGVHRNMIIGNRQYICLLFCWSWPKGWDNFQERDGSRKWGDWFWNRGYRHLCTLVLVHWLIPFFGSPWGTKYNMDF